MILIIIVGGLLSGLFFGFRELIPYIAARRSGVIQRKGARNIHVRRDEDPDGFSRLLANRSKGAMIGFGLPMAAMLVLSLCVVTPLAQSILSAGIYICIAFYAGFCLIRGFSTGRMFGFFSLTLWGEAIRKQNPIWFWIYAILNLLTVLGFALRALLAFKP